MGDIEDFHSEDRGRVRRALLRYMCRNAERMSLLYDQFPILFFGDRPQSFHPSSGDKLIFLGIIDKVLDNVMAENRDETNGDIAGISLLGNCYYPFWS